MQKQSTASLVLCTLGNDKIRKVWFEVINRHFYNSRQMFERMFYNAAWG